MFKLKKQEMTLAEGLMPCLTGEQLWNHPIFKKYDAELRSLISCPQDVYSQLYLYALHRLAEFCQAMPFSQDSYNEPYGLLVRQLSLAINALKYRRGMLLPRNAPIETIAAEEAYWTYAVFLASLLKDLPMLQSDREVTFHHSNGEIAGKWSPQVGSLYENNLYYRMTFVKRPETRSYASMMSLMLGRLVPMRGIRWLLENTEIYSLWLDEVLNESKPNNEITALIAKSGYERKYQFHASKNNEFDLLIEKLIEWIHLSYPSNSENIFQSKSGLFISEDALEDFMSTHHLDKGYCMQSLLKHHWMVLNADLPVHVLSSKRFEDQHLLKGVILNSEYLPEDMKQVPRNTQYIENASL